MIFGACTPLSKAIDSSSVLFSLNEARVSMEICSLVATIGFKKLDPSSEAKPPASANNNSLRLATTGSSFVMFFSRSRSQYGYAKFLPFPVSTFAAFSKSPTTPSRENFIP